MSWKNKLCVLIEPLPAISIGIPSVVLNDKKDLGDNEIKDDKLGDT